MANLGDILGELRSSHGAGDREGAARLLLSVRAQGHPRYADILAYARGVDADVLSPARLVEWADYHSDLGVSRESLRFMQRGGWVMRVCGVEVATHETPGVAAALAKWATRLGWYVLDVWEGDGWVRSAEGEEHRDAPRRCLEIVDAWHRGEASDDVVRVARRAAAAAANAAYINADDYAAYTAAYASHAEAGTAAVNAVFDAPQRQVWHDDWTWHLIRHVLDIGGSPSV